MIDTKFYNPLAAGIWSGRIDGTTSEQRRWHQVVQPIDLNAPDPIHTNVTFLGFASDEGVRRNQGRTGAAMGPASIRKACSNLPAYMSYAVGDAGDITCPFQDLEGAQQQLAHAVEALLRANTFPIVLGGGHEITFGHYNGLVQAYPTAKIGIINIDAHFDLRVPDQAGSSSGTGFWQIAQQCREAGNPFHYLALGIQKAANTPELFERARQLGVKYRLDRSVTPQHAREITETIHDFAQSVDHLYLTIDMDAFSAAYAPGVSAINPRGILPDETVEIILDALFETKKGLSLDIAELNPAFDIDDRTAKLAARLIFEIMERL